MLLDYFADLFADSLSTNSVNNENCYKVVRCFVIGAGDNDQLMSRGFNIQPKITQILHQYFLEIRADNLHKDRGVIV